MATKLLAVLTVIGVITTGWNGFWVLGLAFLPFARIADFEAAAE